jgi:hypothetical protein
MLPTKKPPLLSIIPSPATQVLATSFKPPLYNPTPQTPANVPFKHTQHPPLPRATLNFLQPMCYTNNSQNNKHLPNTTPTPSVSTKFYFERFRLGLITKISKGLFQILVLSPTSLFPGKKQNEGDGLVLYLSSPI